MMTTNARIAAGLFPALALAGCATAIEPRVDEAAAAFLDRYQKTGETASCLGVTRISEIRPVSETVFLVRAGVNDYYVNEVSGRCNGATRGNTRLQYTTSLSQLCRNDIIRVVDNGAGGFTTGSCGLGSFERLEEKPADAEDGA